MAVQNYWGNQNIGTMQQQAQTAGMPQQQNYQSPTGSQQSAATQQANWGAPSQGAWQSPPPSSGGGAAPQSSSQGAGAAWGGGSTGQGGWGQPQPQVQPTQQQWTPQGGQSTGFAPQQQPGGGYSSDAASAIAQAYEQYLGRRASPEEINQRLRDPRFNLQTHIKSIQQSQEAYQHQQQLASQPPPQQQVQPGQPPSWWQQGGQGGPQGSQMPQQPNSQGWNTDGYAKPGYIAQRPAGHPMPGWDRAKWDNPAHQTPKYVVGRILSQYSPSIENLAQAAREIAAAYPGASFNGKDKIYIPGVGTTDVLGNSGSGKNMKWRFGGQSKGGGQAQPVAQQQPAQDPYAAILQQYANANTQIANQYQQPQMPQQGPAAVDPQVSLLQQQLATLRAEQQAQSNQQRNAGPNIRYY